MAGTSRIVELEVASGEARTRLDVWVRARCPALSRERVQGLLKAGLITVDGSVRSAHRLLRPGNRVRVEIPAPVSVELTPQDIPIEILHEDAGIVVVNKPAGLVVHPAAGHASGTLVNALLYRCGDLAGIGGERRPGIVHRLDKDTSGVMVVAKSDEAMAALVSQFKAGTVHKEYLAIVCGHPEPRTGCIETLIGRSARDRKRMSATPRSGRRAVTRYEVLTAFAGSALVRVVIETGRTHQIRVHLAHVGCPVVGDRQYGVRKPRGDVPVAPRQMLHADILEFEHPARRERVRFHAPLPADMRAVLDALR